MQFYKETTDYKDHIVNGTYLLNDSKTKMFAFVPAGSKTVKTFKNPITIDTRGRQFKPVKNTFKYTIPGEAIINPRWEVVGSKGDKYIVEQTEHGLSCTCSGFKFRGKCKHLTQIKK